MPCSSQKWCVACVPSVFATMALFPWQRGFNYAVSWHQHKQTAPTFVPLAPSCGSVRRHSQPPKSPSKRPENQENHKICPPRPAENCRFRRKHICAQRRDGCAHGIPKFESLDSRKRTPKESNLRDAARSRQSMEAMTSTSQVSTSHLLH